MKKNLLSITLILIAATSFGQWLGDNLYTLNFEDTSTIHHLIIDSTINQSHLWQVGIPQKTIFSSAYSSPRAILTDTINSYPTNDISRFEIINIATGGGWTMPHTAILSGYYKVNSDSLSDYGKIEFSPDNGTTWIDLINNTTYSSLIQWLSPKPILTGNSNGWQFFGTNLAQLGPRFNIQYGDTILYRFTFISDSIQTNKDGLMFDDFHFEDWSEGIQEVQSDNLISAYPNPTTYQLAIHRTQNSVRQTIQIFNYSGQMLYDNQNFIGEIIDTRQLNNGIYVLKYSDTKSFSIKKFIVNH